MSRQQAPASCRYCRAGTWLADADGPVHACCSAWRDVIEAGYRCPACEAGPWLRSKQNAGREMRPLPRRLPDGRPFMPDLGRVEEVFRITGTVTELQGFRDGRRRPSWKRADDRQPARDTEHEVLHMSDEYESGGAWSDGQEVMVRYPLDRWQRPAGVSDDEAHRLMTAHRENWPWLRGVIESQCGPDEWAVLVDAREVAEMEDGSPAPEGTPGDDLYSPRCFRDATEIMAEGRPPDEISRHLDATDRVRDGVPASWHEADWEAGE